MRIIKLLGKILLLGAGLLVILLFISTLYHNFQLRSEADEYPPPGKVVKVNNRDMHVYTAGEGDLTLVFMAGSGTSSPTIDFKPLWMRMTNEYRIAVVEKAGYGWSETSDSPRDIDTMLTETKKALELSGESGPYVLLPHSMSGLEAIYWAQKYPEEVSAIIGLDMAIPDYYLDPSFPMPSKVQLYLMNFIARTGITRLMGEETMQQYLPLLKSEDLSNEDKERLIATFYKSTLTKNMISEGDYVMENAQKVKENGIPKNTPMYLFIAKESNEKIIPSWEEKAIEYLSEVNEGKARVLDSGHYLHYEKANLITSETKRFLNEMGSN